MSPWQENGNVREYEILLYAHDEYKLIVGLGTLRSISRPIDGTWSVLLLVDAKKRADREN